MRDKKAGSSLCSRLSAWRKPLRGLATRYLNVCAGSGRVNGFGAVGAGGGSRTHRGLRPTGCHAVAFTSFATPEPKSAANRGSPRGDTPSVGGRCRPRSQRYRHWRIDDDRDDASRIQNLLPALWQRAEGHAESIVPTVVFLPEQLGAGSRSPSARPRGSLWSNSPVFWSSMDIG